MNVCHLFWQVKLEIVICSNFLFFSKEMERCRSYVGTWLYTFSFCLKFVNRLFGAVANTSNYTSQSARAPYNMHNISLLPSKNWSFFLAYFRVDPFFTFYIYSSCKHLFSVEFGNDLIYLLVHWMRSFFVHTSHFSHLGFVHECRLPRSLTHKSVLS